MRRLNRREYRNTIRDLLGVDFDVAAVFPADGTGGAGFDTNGETLYIPPLLMERYLEAAQQILDRVIVTPPLVENLRQPPSCKPRVPSPLRSTWMAITTCRVSVDAKDTSAKLTLKVDGADAGALADPRREARGAADAVAAA